MPAPQSQFVQITSPSAPPSQITAAAVLLREGVERGEETTMGLPLEVARPHRANARRFGVTDQTGTKRKSYLVVNSLPSSASLVSI